MGIMDQIRAAEAAAQASIEDRQDKQRQAVLAELLGKLTFEGAPEPQWIEQIHEKEYAPAPHWSRDARTIHHLYEVVTIDDIVIHARNHSNGGWYFYLPSVCVACRKPERISVSLTYIKDVDMFAKKVGEALANFKTRSMSRCWECRKELP